MEVAEIEDLNQDDFVFDVVDAVIGAYQILLFTVTVRAARSTWVLQVLHSKLETSSFLLLQYSFNSISGVKCSCWKS